MTNSALIQGGHSNLPASTMVKKYIKPAICIVTVQQRMGLLAGSLLLHNEVSTVQLSRESFYWDDEEDMD